LIPFSLVTGTVEPGDNGITIVTMLLQLSLISAVLIIARHHAGVRWRDTIAWRPWSFRRHAVLFGVLLAAALAFNEIGGLIIRAYSTAAPKDAVATLRLGLPFVLDCLSNVILAAVMEEFVVRGWLFTALRSRLAAWPTILATAVIFAMPHGISSIRAILTTLPLRLAAGYLRERSGSVRPAMALHLAHNAVAYGLLLIG
jgi:membrane protease YdiL (CAAX protease family)